MCDYVTNDKSSLSYHMKAAHEKIRFQCEECFRKFTKKNMISVDKKTKRCDQCKNVAIKFTVKESLQRHVKEVYGELMFPCPECRGVH